ncbi:MAG: hypothetical protein WBR26_20810 [Candidatus Acidiferrum sp.]
MQLKTKAGLAVLALGVVIFAVWNHWIKTRRFVPLDIPVTWTAGQTITSEFHLNFDGLYVIEIVADQSIPAEKLHCLMDVQANPILCKDLPSAIIASWILWNAGKAVMRGDSNMPHSANADTDGISRVIGQFQGKSGQFYNLQLTFASDGASLVPAHPRLKVTAASIVYTDLQSASVLVFSMVFICVLFGVILLGMSYYINRRVNAM